jgi:hypothetical protein
MQNNGQQGDGGGAAAKNRNMGRGRDDQRGAKVQQHQRPPPATVKMAQLDAPAGHVISVATSIFNQMGLSHLCGAITHAQDGAYANQIAVNPSGHGQRDFSLLNVCHGEWERTNHSLNAGAGVSGPKGFRDGEAFVDHIMRFSHAPRVIIYQGNFLVFRALMYLQLVRLCPTPIDCIEGGSYNDFLKAAKVAATMYKEYLEECGGPNANKSLAELEGIIIGRTLEELGRSRTRPAADLLTLDDTGKGTPPYKYIEVYDRGGQGGGGAATGVGAAANGVHPAQPMSPGAHAPVAQPELPPGIPPQATADEGAAGDSPGVARKRAKLEGILKKNRDREAAKCMQQRRITEMTAARDQANAAAAAAADALAKVVDEGRSQRAKDAAAAKQRAQQDAETEARLDAQIKAAEEGSASEGESAGYESESQGWAIPDPSDDDEGGAGGGAGEETAYAEPAQHGGIRLFIEGASIKCTTKAGQRTPNVKAIKDALGAADIRVQKRRIHGVRNIKTTKPRRAVITLSVARESYGLWDDILNDKAKHDRAVDALSGLLNKDGNKEVRLVNDDTLPADWAGMSVEDKMSRDTAMITKKEGGASKKRGK